MKIWRLLATLGISLLPTGLLAHGGGIEHIQSFHSDITVSHQNQLDITETIIYDFGDNFHHGIYRYIPISAPATSEKSYYISYDFRDVLMDNAPVKVSEEGDFNKAIIKIGDPNATITGVHTYQIRYTLSPVVIKNDKGAFLNLDITGNDWQVAIEEASAVVHLEDGAALSHTACFGGAFASTESNCQVTGNNIRANNLLIGQGLTLNAYLPDGYVAKYLEPTYLPRFNWWQWLLIVGVPLLIFTALLVMLLRWVQERRRKSRQTIIPQYEAPDQLTPAEIGFLHDDKASVVEITATLIDLAVRGYIRIVQAESKSLFKKAKYRLDQLKNFSGANDYETALLNAVFAGESLLATTKIVDKGKAVNVMQSVNVDDIDKYQMAIVIVGIKKTLKKRLSAKGYYGITQVEPNLISKAIDGGNISDKGAVEWAKVEGLKLYLGVAEKDRLKFTDAPERTPERFNKLLPYAVALGVEKEWAKQFEDIDMAGHDGWYSSSLGTWTAFSLASDLSSGFSASISSSASHASSSGGSSGGGFGGGGGGSW